MQAFASELIISYLVLNLLQFWDSSTFFITFINVTYLHESLLKR